MFARTYNKTGPGTYIKSTAVWAEAATSLRLVVTKEGCTGYETGDYIVSNNEDGTDAYAIGKAKFESMYVRDE